MRPKIGITTTFDDTEGTKYAVSTHYVRAIVAAGGLPLLIPCVVPFNVQLIAASIDGLLLPGGVDVDPLHYGQEPDRLLGYIDPVADEFELALCRYFLGSGRPVLGVCRGVQLLNVAAGGDLYQDIPGQTNSRLQHAQKAPEYYPTHDVHLKSESRLGRLIGKETIRVNTFHHQAVRRVAPGYQSSATASDGLIEAIERLDGAFALGVQWHPERMINKRHSLAIFEGLVAASRKKD